VARNIYNLIFNILFFNSLPLPRDTTPTPHFTSSAEMIKPMVIMKQWPSGERVNTAAERKVLLINRVKVASGRHEVLLYECAEGHSDTAYTECYSFMSAVNRRKWTLLLYLQLW
jgi:hypothetical protein